MKHVHFKLYRFNVFLILMIFISILSGCFSSSTSESTDKIVVTDGTGTITRMPNNLNENAYSLLDQTISTAEMSKKDVSTFGFQTIVKDTKLKGIQYHLLKHKKKKIDDREVTGNVFVLIPKGNDALMVIYNDKNLVAVYTTKGVASVIEKLIESSFKKH